MDAVEKDLLAGTCRERILLTKFALLNILAPTDTTFNGNLNYMEKGSGHGWKIEVLLMLTVIEHLAVI